MKLREKLSLAFLTLAAIVGIVGYASMAINADIEKSALELGTGSTFELKLSHDMAQALDAAQASAERVLLQRHRAAADPSQRAEAHKEADRAREAAMAGLHKLEQRLMTARRVVREFDQEDRQGGTAEKSAGSQARAGGPLEELTREVAVYKALLADYFRAAESDPRAAWELLAAKLEPHYRTKVTPLIDEFGKLFELRRSRRIRRMLEGVHQANRLVMISTLVAFFFAAFLGLFLSSRISSPITKLTAAALEIGKGHLDTHVDVSRKDELGTLADTFNRMAHDLSTTMVSKSYVDNIIRSMGDALVVTDRQGAIQRVNQALLRLLGYEEADLIGESVNRLIGEQDRFGSKQVRFATQKDAIRNVETTYVTKSGDAIPVSLTVSALYDDAGRMQGIVFVAQDITERKQAEQKLLTYQEQLRSLAALTSLAEERHRRRLATVVDDRIGDSLAACKIKIGALRESARGAGLAPAVGEIRDILEETIEQTRALIFELSSPILYELGLEEAVEALVQQTSDRLGIEVTFRNDGKPKLLDEAIRVVLFQSVRGLLHNVADHAQARSAKVSLREHDDHVRVEVEDDGVGFDTASLDAGAASTRGGSLFEIRERLSYLGGSFEIESSPGHGTRARLFAPLKGRQARRQGS